MEPVLVTLVLPVGRGSVTQDVQSVHDTLADFGWSPTTISSLSMRQWHRDRGTGDSVAYWIVDEIKLDHSLVRLVHENQQRLYCFLVSREVVRHAQGSHEDSSTSPVVQVERALKPPEGANFLSLRVKLHLTVDGVPGSQETIPQCTCSSATLCNACLGLCGNTAHAVRRCRGVFLVCVVHEAVDDTCSPKPTRVHIVFSSPSATMNTGIVQLNQNAESDNIQIAESDNIQSEIKDNNQIAGNNDNQIAEKTQGEETQNRSGWGGKGRTRNANRSSIFVSFLQDKFGREYLNSGAGILDVAGGKGDLSFRLKVYNGHQSTIVDPRPCNVLRLLALLTKSQIARFTIHATSPEECAIKTFDLPLPEHCRCFFEHPLPAPSNISTTAGSEEGSSFYVNDMNKSDPRHLQKLYRRAREASAIVGMHPDQATEAIVDCALELGKPFAVVPCCVFPQLYPERTKLGVRTHKQFCEYLVQKDPDKIQSSILDFAGRNVVIWSAARLPATEARSTQ